MPLHGVGCGGDTTSGRRTDENYERRRPVQLDKPRADVAQSERHLQHTACQARRQNGSNDTTLTGNAQQPPTRVLFSRRALASRGALC